MILLEDPLTKERFHSLPGGGVEENESIEDCAVRETLEETGYHITLTSKAFTTRYPFTWNGTDYDCTTHWFTASLMSLNADPVDDEEYVLAAQWLPINQAIELLNEVPATRAPLKYFLASG